MAPSPSPKHIPGAKYVRKSKTGLQTGKEERWTVATLSNARRAGLKPRPGLLPRETPCINTPEVANGFPH